MTWDIDISDLTPEGCTRPFIVYCEPDATLMGRIDTSHAG